MLLRNADAEDFYIFKTSKCNLLAPSLQPSKAQAGQGEAWENKRRIRDARKRRNIPKTKRDKPTPPHTGLH